MIVFVKADFGPEPASVSLGKPFCKNVGISDPEFPADPRGLV